MKKQILSLIVVLLIGSTVCMAQNRQKRKVERETYHRFLHAFRLSQFEKRG